MAKKLSRRSLMRGAAATAVAMAVPTSLAQQQTQPAPEDPMLDQRLDALEKQLAHPLAPDVKKLTRTSLKNLDTERSDRLKTILPENSEPSFTYITTEVKK